MFRRSHRFFCSCSSYSSSSSSSSPLSTRPHHRVKDTFFKKYNPLDDRKRIVVLVDAETVPVPVYFSTIKPVLKAEFSTGTHNILLHRIFAHNLKRDWQQILINREEGFDHFKVERFIALHMQMVADAAHIAQRRLHNKAQGVVFCCMEPVAPLIEDQLRKRDALRFVDRCVIHSGGKISMNEIVGNVQRDV